jgi:hypothetical protein
LDHKERNIKGGWWDQQRDMMGLIEVEKQDRAQLATLFNWASRDVGVKAEDMREPAKLGTTLQTK